GRITRHSDAGVNSSPGELGIFFEGKILGYRRRTVIKVGRGHNRLPLVGYHATWVLRDAKRVTIFRNGSQVKLIQIHRTEGQVESPAADVRGTHDNLVGQFIFQAKVVVVRSRCGLGVQHST